MADIDAQTTTGGILDAYRQLRALWLIDAEGWARYMAGEPADGVHILDIGTAAPHYRTLIRGEHYWWALGLADGHGYGQLVEAITTEPLPAFVTLTEAAQLLPAVDRWGTRRAGVMTRDGVEYNIHAGALYPVYASGPSRARQRFLFRAQVEALAAARRADAAERDSAPASARRARAAAERAAERWAPIRQKLPPAIRPSALTVDVTPLPSPDPLPVVRRQVAATRLHAMMAGQKAGWFQYSHQDPDEGTYVVQVDDLSTGEAVRRALPADAVLPWVLGVADQRGRGARFAYRAELG